MTVPLMIRVYGTPAPQGSKTGIVSGDRAVLIEGGSPVGRQKHAAWRAAVTGAAHEQVKWDERLDDDTAFAVAVAFQQPRPRSTPKKRVWTSVKPDLDKLLRSTLDGLADGKVFKEDSRCVLIVSSHRYVGHDPDDRGDAWSGADIRIWPLDRDAESSLANRIWAAIPDPSLFRMPDEPKDHP